MRFGKMVAALLGAAGILVAPATVAQAAPVSSCAPTDEAAWTGSFVGPHTDERTGTVSDQEIRTFRSTVDGIFRVGFDGAMGSPGGFAYAWADTSTGLLRQLEPDHPILGLETTSATCDAGGDVVSFAGTYYHFYNWASCAFCVTWGTFEVTRV
ncbi:hypothetical protein [Actinophytocola xinjiangensis]|nr:hypothetical protein [Actinophytocola xinjiangensis]